MKKQLAKTQRQTRIRKKIRDISNRPRLSVFRSNQHIFAQIIDDVHAKTLVAVSDTSIKEKKMNKSEVAKLVGIKIAELAKMKKVREVVFDKGSYRYHGRVFALAEGAREGGLKF